MLSDEIGKLARDLGADFLGVADLGRVRETIGDVGELPLTDFPRAIAVGIALLHDIVDQLTPRADLAVMQQYRHHCYDVVNARLDVIVSRLAGRLQEQGHCVLPIPASRTVDAVRQRGFFSHKMAARLAGLGWIGKNCLLIHPQVGPRVRWASVLTNAPLTPTGAPLDRRCGDCSVCVDSCPPHALTGAPFREQDDRDVRFAAAKCKAWLDERERTTGLSVCGLCVAVCPHGRRPATV